MIPTTIHFLSHNAICFITFHYNDVIMRAMASQITSISIVCSNICSGIDQRKCQSSQRASNAENVFIWWHHHASISEWFCFKYLFDIPIWKLMIYHFFLHYIWLVFFKTYGSIATQQSFLCTKDLSNYGIDILLLLLLNSVEPSDAYMRR